MYLHLLFDLLYLEHQSWSNSHSFDELVVWASHCHFETKERKCKKFLSSLNNTQILFGKFFLQESAAGWSHQIWSPTIRAL